MQYQIKDGSDKLLGENEYLVPVKISKQGLMEELEIALAVTTDRGGFLSYKNVPAFVYTDQIEHTARRYSAWLPPIQCTLSGHQCMMLIQV